MLATSLPLPPSAMDQQSARSNERVCIHQTCLLECSREYLTNASFQDVIVNRYMRLNHESDRLRQRLSLALSLHTSLPFSSRKSSTSPSSGSASRGESSHYSWRSTSQSPVMSPRTERHDGFLNEACPTPPLPGSQQSHVSRTRADSADETALFEVNQQIKATLTELLNCQDVKSDQDFRSWVQERLMEAEQEIRRQRRRKSSAERRGRTEF